MHLERWSAVNIIGIYLCFFILKTIKYLCQHSCWHQWEFHPFIDLFYPSDAGEAEGLQVGRSLHPTFRLLGSITLTPKATFRVDHMHDGRKSGHLERKKKLTPEIETQIHLSNSLRCWIYCSLTKSNYVFFDNNDQINSLDRMCYCNKWWGE